MGHRQSSRQPSSSSRKRSAEDDVPGVSNRKKPLTMNGLVEQPAPVFKVSEKPIISKKATMEYREKAKNLEPETESETEPETDSEDDLQPRCRARSTEIDMKKILELLGKTAIKQDNRPKEGLKLRVEQLKKQSKPSQ